MCRKIRCDGESCKVLGFGVYLNKALNRPIDFNLFDDLSNKVKLK